MKIKMIYERLSKFLLILGLVLLLLPLESQAALTQSEVVEQLDSVSLALVSLGEIIQTNEPDLSPFIRSEVQRIFGALSSILSQLLLALSPTPAPAGQVLGASYPLPSQPAFGDIGFAVVKPSGSGSIKQILSGKTGNVLYFNIKAFNSNVSVVQVNVSFNDRIWRWAEEISLVVGAKTLAKIPAEEANFSSSNGQYTLHFSGFSLKIGEERSATLHIKLKIRKYIPGEAQIKAFLNNYSIVVLGHPKVSSKLPEQGGGPDGSFSRLFKIKRQ